MFKLNIDLYKKFKSFFFIIYKPKKEERIITKIWIKSFINEYYFKKKKILLFYSSKSTSKNYLNM